MSNGKVSMGCQKNIVNYRENPAYWKKMINIWEEQWKEGKNCELKKEKSQFILGANPAQANTDSAQIRKCFQINEK